MRNEIILALSAPSDFPLYPTLQRHGARFGVRGVALAG